MISEVATAIVGKLGLNKLGGVIHPYSTHADAYGRKLLTDNNKRLLRFLTKLF
ncbi:MULTISPECIES: hypothetical protein [Calothrix]|uniref:Pyridine nucleotide-disulphide oxidoreductase dimerisation domain-containing protein n=2 Tax=Calothrix TaxID=1186 RepID=A0ABR8AGT8_9CYAN|nr:hypothetical protein [Calothrix parietina FACHB-288]MBD2227974.1 hypothetical protein [Calothrix anomala FACHB-343]